jgi:hypothetical protein
LPFYFEKIYKTDKIRSLSNIRLLGINDCVGGADAIVLLRLEVNMKKLLLVFAFIFMSSISVFAAAPVKLSLWNSLYIPQDDSLTGIELGIGSYTPNMTGFMFDFLVGKTDEAVGVQIAMITITKNISGIQFGFINVNYQEIAGAQIGLFNNAESVNGLQLGLINLTTDMKGVQLGLLNYIANGRIITESFPAMIIINANF